MSNLFTNWTKLVIGIIAIILTIGYVFGRITSDDFRWIFTAALGLQGLHAGVSGINGLVGGDSK